MLADNLAARPIDGGARARVYQPRPTRPADTIAERFARSPHRTLSAHDQLFREGDDRTNIYEVVEGAFVLYRLLPNGRRQVIGFAVGGDMVGLGSGSSHPFSAEAISTAKVRAIPTAALNRMALEDPSLGLRLYDALSQELVTAQTLLMMVGRLNAAERVATFLLSMAERNIRALRRADRIELPMTRCDIADFLGLTTETVSRTLTKLENSNVISRQPGYISIVDADALEDVAAGDHTI